MTQAPSSVRNGGGRSDAGEAPEAASLRRQLLLRAGVAAGLIVVLLGGLAVYDRMSRAPAPPPAAPVVQAPPAAPPSADAPAAAAEAIAPPDPLPGREAPPEPELASAPELAPPGQRRADAPTPRDGTPRLVLGGESAAPPPPAQPAAAKAPAAAPPAAEAAPPAPLPSEIARTAGGKGYLVQMGVFTSLDNAQALQTRLAGLGIPVRLESRVVLGPFPDQAAARAAQARLREAGEGAGVVLAPRR